MKAFIRGVPEKVQDKEVIVGCTASEGLVHLYGKSDDHAWRRSFDPGEAAKIWGVVFGNENCSAHIVDTDGCSMKVWVEIDKDGRHSETDVYRFYDEDLDEVLFEISDYQGNALGWAIERCCGEAMSTSSPGRELAASIKEDVWTLTVAAMLTGDCAENGVDQLCASSLVFRDMGDAVKRAEEIVAERVENSYTEEFWEAGKEEGVSKEDIVREVLEGVQNVDGAIVWLHDGQKQSFEIRIEKKAVE